MEEADSGGCRGAILAFPLGQERAGRGNYTPWRGNRVEGADSALPRADKECRGQLLFPPRGPWGRRGWGD